MQITPEDIDQLLPQTQCGLCGQGGCLPYAEAIIFEKAPINLCPPGGVKTLQALGTLLQQDPTPYLTEMAAKEKPLQLAVIRENECIGCTKCIQACPVDAIVGSAKQMHTVITDQCTGCELCIPPCPVDCIDLITAATTEMTTTQKDLARQRFQQREQRLKKEKTAKEATLQTQTRVKKQAYVQEAITRSRLLRATEKQQDLLQMAQEADQEAYSDD
ncbi:MAG TPA: RnfABCDGE type electron transport complex subunit B [Gammaproteobacteria bacterium]|jgi:electron transport complex protein RnfB|nr:RnfABCDGE type electron transport complex subunit B [Gammaproteobacteria bacterium]